MAAEHARKLAKQGRKVSPVVIAGRAIARSFWGRTWCDHMGSYSDYANRLPRGARYVRNGSVFDLQIKAGKVVALVSGSEIYNVDITFKPLEAKRWKMIQDQCGGQIASVVELLQGKFSDAVMRVLTDRETGMFPAPREIDFDCSCPDSAGMCKHIAAVLYGVGSRLDHQPELFFTLRQVNQLELINAAGRQIVTAPSNAATIAAGDLADVFGIDIDSGSTAVATPSASPKEAKPRAANKAAKPPVVKKTMRGKSAAARGNKGKVSKRRP